MFERTIETMATIDEEIKSKFMHERHRLMVNLMFTSNWIDNEFSDAIKPFGISSQQYNILRILRGNKGWMTMNDIKSRMIQKAPNATRLSDKLLDKDLIERKRCDEDRRVVYLKINQKGLLLIAEIDEASSKNESLDFFEKITEEEAKLLNPILDKLRG